MTVALHGNLRDFGIGEVFQLIGQQRKTGRLEVEGEEDRISVTFDEGAVVCAAAVGPSEHAALGDMLVRTELLTPDRLVEVERHAAASGDPFHRLLIRLADLSAQQVEEIEELVTQETIFTLLRWHTGSFHFRPETVQHSRDRARLLPAEQILMDGLRMVDEWRALDPDASRVDAVFQRVDGFESYREWARSDSAAQIAAAERVFVSIDGRLTVRRVIDLARTGTFDGARILTGLRRAGVIDPVDPVQLPRVRRSQSRGLAGSALVWVGGLLPFLLLAGLAFVLARPASPAAGGRDFPILRDPLAEARAAAATRRMRNLVEAHRFASGRWPRDLQQLAQRGWITPQALAGAGSGPYYFAETEGGVVVLAPER